MVKKPTEVVDSSWVYPPQPDLDQYLMNGYGLNNLNELSTYLDELNDPDKVAEHRNKLEEYHLNELNEYCERHQVTKPHDTTVDDLPNTNHEEVAKLDREALEENELTGKWNVFQNEPEVDRVWECVAECVAEGLIWRAKASTKQAKEEKTRGGDDYVVIVYTPNYIDETDVFRVRELLEERCGITATLYYKPDIYTKKGIYRDTASERGLPGASRYSG